MSCWYLGSDGKSIHQTLVEPAAAFKGSCGTSSTSKQQLMALLLPVLNLGRLSGRRRAARVCGIHKELFAAVLESGAVVTWDVADWGGDSSQVQE